MKKFVSLTKYIPEFRNRNFGQWFIDESSKDYPHSPLAMSQIRYSSSVQDFGEDLQTLCDLFPEYGAEHYVQTLEALNLENLDQVDPSQLDEKAILALLFGAFRSDYFCSGSFLDYLNSGSVLRWLERLFELDNGHAESSLSIIKGNLLESDAEAVVNAANNALKEGSGVCGAIFQAAGKELLKEACDALSPCATGHAVTTPGFGLGAKAIIHAVGPKWEGGSSDEEDYLYHVYQSALDEVVKNDLHSVAFPLISSGIYGYPKEEAWEIALSSVSDYLAQHSGIPLSVRFHVLSDKDLELGQSVLEKVRRRPSAHTTRHVSVIPFTHNGGENSFLDSYYQRSFNLGGKRYCCVEQYLMEQKALLAGDYSTAAKIMKTNDPNAMRAFGSYVRSLHAAEWDGLKELFAYRASLAKFSQNPVLRAKLLDTGDAIPVLCSESDLDWGTGLKADDVRINNPEKWKGQNLLGFILQSVRSALSQD